MLGARFGPAGRPRRLSHNPTQDPPARFARVRASRPDRVAPRYDRGMQELKYAELEMRASDAILAEAERADVIRALEARSHVFSELQKMKDEGKAITLSGEEMDLLSSFRRFKLRMRKHGEVFTWQTRKPEGVEAVEESALIVHPRE